MSEFKKTRDVSTYQKLPPPKSLQGEEDAEVTWDLILKRYPNAAPLLCQMETVIERAEGLLQQLRSPYTHVLERSSSFQIADSEDELMGPCHVEESTEVSMISEQDSRLASDENMTPEIVSISTRSMSDKISEDYQEGKSAGVESSEMLKAGEKARSLDVNSSSMYESNSKNFPVLQGLEIKTNLGQEHGSKSPVISVVNLTESQTPLKKLLGEQEVGKSSSLEAWGKVVGENVVPNQTRHSEKEDFESDKDPPGVVETKEDSVSEHARRLNVVKIGPTDQIKGINLIGKKEELTQRFAGTISTASKIVDPTISVEKNEGIQEAINHVEPVIADARDDSKNREIEYSEKNLHVLGDRTINTSGNICRDLEEPNEMSETISGTVENKFNEVQGNGDDAIGTPRSPVEILDEYSKICGIAVEYKNQSPSSSFNKNVVVKCCFGGFAFEACAQSKKSAKKDAAGKLLRCLTGRQMDGENICDLTPFTRKQIEEIISLGNGGECETAVRKLYKMCMELNVPEPIYTVHQGSSIVGNRYTVKCGALGITTSGYGIRVIIAKRVAADKLLHNYHENLNASH